VFAISDNFKSLYPFFFVSLPYLISLKHGHRLNKKAVFIFVSISNFLDKYACR